MIGPNVHIIKNKELSKYVDSCNCIFMEKIANTDNLFIGKIISNFGSFSNGITSSYPKLPVDSFSVSKDWILGNEIADLKHHAGFDRVIHYYPKENYEMLSKQFPQNQVKFNPGSFGENLCAFGMQEEDVFLGDIVQMGTIRAQVTGPRFPCGKIDLQYGEKGIYQYVLTSFRVGWFYQILKEGKVDRNDPIYLIKRGNDKLSMYAMMQEFSVKKTFNPDMVKECLAESALGKFWKNRLLQ